MYMRPHSVWDSQAHYYYPALPETTRNGMTLKEFRKRLRQILIETGDIDKDGRYATDLGESHGFRNRLAGGWDGDIHYTTSIVAPGDSQDYLIQIIAEYFPGFDEKLYHESRRQQEIAQRLDSHISSHHTEYRVLPQKVREFVFNMAENKLDEWIDHLVYVCMEKEYIAPFLSVFSSIDYVFEGLPMKREPDITRSGEQINLAVKTEKYLTIKSDSPFLELDEEILGKKNYLLGQLATSADHDIIIYNFEEIVGEDAQESMAQSIRDSLYDYSFNKKRRARFILVSSLMPYEYHINNDDLRRFVLSAPAYDLRTTKPYHEFINYIAVKGRITGAPKRRFSPSDTPVLSFPLTIYQEANSNTSLNRVNCVAYYKNAEFIEHYYKDNDLVIVVGKIRNYRSTDEKGRTTSLVEIICDNVYPVPEESQEVIDARNKEKEERRKKMEEVGKEIEKIMEQRRREDEEE